MSKFEDAIEYAVDEVLEQAKKLSEATNRTVISCAMTLLRPHILDCVDPDARSAKWDNRTRKWNVRLTFAAITGDNVAEIISQSESELMQGFDEVLCMIQEYAEQTHENSMVDIRSLHNLTTTNLKKRLGGMRPAISKSGGYAHTVLQYMVDEQYYACKVEITREDIPLDKPVAFGG